MIIRNSEQFKGIPNLPGTNHSPFDYVKQQNEINKSNNFAGEDSRKEQAENLKKHQNENFARKFSNPLSGLFKK